jgi:hypothetical protein
MKAAALTSSVVAEIAAFESHKMSDGQHKPVLVFAGDELPNLVLNKSNLGMLQDALGIESDNYIGCRVRITKINTTYQGRPTPGLSLEVLTPKTKPGLTPDLDDEINF